MIFLYFYIIFYISFKLSNVIFCNTIIFLRKIKVTITWIEIGRILE